MGEDKLSIAKADVAPLDTSGSRKPARLASRLPLTALRRCALGAVVAGWVGFGCGTPAIFVLTAPSSVTADTPFTVTVTAMVGQSRDTVINSSIQFTSSDKAAVLPPVYYFTAADAGSHTFTNGVTLKTPGSQSITATDIGAPGLNGTTTVTVVAQPALAQASAPSGALQQGTP